MARSRPRPFAVGRVRVRVHSGPRADGRWRWRADRPAGTREGRDVREAVWSGWGTRDEAETAVLEALTTRGERWKSTEDIRTVYDLLDVWVADVEPHDRSPRTSASRRGCTERLSGPLGDVALARLDRPAIDRYVRGYQGAASTLRQDLRALRAAWAWGRERVLVPDRSLPSIRIRDDGGKYSRYTPSAEEVARVLEVLREQATWAWRACYLLWATGCRPSEIASLTWSDIDAARCTLAVRGKTGARTIPLHPIVIAEIETWSHGPQVRPGGRKATTAPIDSVCGCQPATVRSRLHDRLADACAALELPRWNPYGLRRAAVAKLYRSGEDPSVAAAVLGHSPAVALKHYRQVAHADLADAVRRSGMGLLPSIGDVIDLETRRRDRD